MGSLPAISARGLGKQYRLGEREPYGTLRDTLVRAVRAPARWRRADRSGAAPTVWALDDVSFDIGEGDVVGIIGRNGSGKSTLLRILSRITEPTRGTATVRGRVGSLLEVGTGFHPELTGRENVFVNGAMLGMRRHEILRRFDDIVGFAGVDRFIDTPVKRYSSGMQMRLAFAVAAHLEPHILLVDEVLAVGDAEFQRRCLGKMHDVSREGRTVLLVSHQMGQIRRLCRSVLWLDGGRLRAAGPTGETIHEYEAATLARDLAAGGSAFLGWDLGDGEHRLVDTTGPVRVRVHLAAHVAVTNGHFGLGLLGVDDEVIGGWAFEPLSFPAGTRSLTVELPSLPIRPGVYRWSMALFDGGNNLSGGRLLEKWTAVPDLALEARPLGHPQDAWAGILNLRGALTIDRQSQALPSAVEVR